VALQKARGLRPEGGVHLYPVLGQHADVFAEPFGLHADFALQRLGDLGQHRAHVHVKGRAPKTARSFRTSAKLKASLRLSRTGGSR